jgi:hypothetical protein
MQQTRSIPVAGDALLLAAEVSTSVPSGSTTAVHERVR